VEEEAVTVRLGMLDLLRKGRLKCSEFGLYMGIVLLARSGYRDGSMGELAFQLNIGRTTLYRVMKKLIEAGVVEKRLVGAQFAVYRELVR
jgi:predicted transcriptional regulator